MKSHKFFLGIFTLNAFALKFHVDSRQHYSQPWDQLPLSFDIFVSLISVERKSNLLNISTVQLYHDTTTVARLTKV